MSSHYVTAVPKQHGSIPFLLVILFNSEKIFFYYVLILCGLLSKFLLMSLSGCVNLLLCACEDTTPFKVWGGYVSVCFGYVFMYVLCKALLSNIYVWI